MGFVQGHFAADKYHTFLDVMCYRNVCVGGYPATTSLLSCLWKHRRLSIAWKAIHIHWGLLFGAYLAQIKLLGLISSGVIVWNGYTLIFFFNYNQDCHLSFPQTGISIITYNNVVHRWGNSTGSTKTKSHVRWIYLPILPLSLEMGFWPLLFSSTDLNIF